MLIKRPSDIASSEITPEQVYLDRRKFMGAAAGTVASGLLGSGSVLAQNDDYRIRSADELNLAAVPLWLQEQVNARTPASSGEPFNTSEKMAPFDDAAGYNNFYEFGTGKRDPANNARDFHIEPWTVEIKGEVAKPGTYTLEDILRPHTLEDRVYRLRCVEAWSMVIPWLGFPLSELIRRFEPTADANYIEFLTLADREQMPGVRSRFATIDWPYQEGLRMDEAMNPLTLMAVGLYGNVLPAQNGAPLRLVVPWKYGFKSIKSIVSINFRKDMPPNTWNTLQPGEYGFYANVNPSVSHPRWSQATERRLPSSLFEPERIATRMFNGYEEQVAHLYEGMDLRRNY